MLKFTLSFLAGASQLLWLPELKLVWLLACAPIFTIALYFFFTQKFKIISTIVLGITLGMAYVIGFGLTAKSHQLDNIPNSFVVVTGKISNLPIDKNDKVKFAFDINKIDKNIKLRKLLVSWYKTDEIVRAGQVWQFELKLKPIHGYNNPGSFDYSKWLFRQGYDATATVKKAKLINEYANDVSSLVNQQRGKLSKLIEDSFTSSRVQALVKALTIGDKSQISYEDSQLFQDTGTAHLIAISGLHIGLMAYIGLLFGRLLFVLITNEKFNRFKYEAIFAISFALLYALLAGLSIPTIRALVMVVVFSLANVFKAQINKWQSWSIAMMIVLVIDPFSVLDVGFWFSFGAVGVLMFAFTGRSFTNNKILSFTKAQMIILIGLMPLMVMVFGQVNLLTPIANLLVLPLASLLLIPLMLASFILYFVSERMASFLFEIVEELAQLLFIILDYLQQFNFLTIPLVNNTPIVGSLILISVVLLLPKLFRWRYFVLLLLVAVVFQKPIKLDEKKFQVNVLDVGQGLSIVIKTRNHTLVYDTGSKYDTGFNLASTVVIPYLEKKGINNVDKLILSHKDNDHAGGLSEMMAAYPTMKIYDVSGQYHTCDMQLEWQWNQVKFQVLSPFEIEPYLGNNSSCVLKITNQYGSILITGDIEDPVEYRLLQQRADIIKSDVLLVPHHGSRTSSSLEFVQQVNPKIAINSSGYANQFNHPHPKIRQLYLDQKIEFIDTQDKGMIKLLFSEEGIIVEKYSEVNHHFWQID